MEASIIRGGVSIMDEFIKNTGKVLEYLGQKNACCTIVSATRNCFRQLRVYLEEKKVTYSHDEAAKWILVVSGKYVSDTISLYKNALCKLDDVYEYGEVRRLTRFKSDGTYFGHLTEKLRRQLEDFLSELSANGSSNATIENYTREISRIFYSLHTHYGLDDFCAITYDEINGFYNNDVHEGRFSKRYANEVFTRILCFYYKKGKLPFGYTIFIHYLSLGKGTFWNNVSKPAMDEIRSLQSIPGRAYTLEEFRTAQEEIKEIHFRELYSKTARTSYNKWLGALYLFLEMNGFVYTPETAWVWYSQIAEFTGRENRTAKRALCLMEQKLSAGKTDLSVMFREKPNAFLRLPQWCVPDVGAFFRMKASEGWASSTLCMYRSCVCRFCMFLDSKGITSFSEVAAADIKEFNRNDRHKTPAGKNAYNVRIRKFLSYLGEMGKLKNSMLFVALPSVSAPKETLVVTLSKDEIETIKQAVHEDSRQLTLRKKAMLLLGLRMGIRSSDIVNLLLEDIDWNRVTLRFIQEKTDVEVILPIPTDAANALYRYLMQERPQTDCRNIFIRERAPYHSVGRSACQRALESALPERDVPGSGFHVTRKTYASSLLEGGVGINMVAEALGQTGTGAVHRYLSLDGERMQMCPLSLAEKGLLMKGVF